MIVYPFTIESQMNGKPGFSPADCLSLWIFGLRREISTQAGKKSVGRLRSAKLSDEARCEAIEQRHFGNFVRDGQLATLQPAQKIGPGALEGGFPVTVYKEEAGFERADIGQLCQPG